ncbi:MAG: trypsin-like peptidase domain-containing protein [Defluviitaleaceae bacterium]|nr:trypsin-like peptidase domain-containing protein [Defluviitaleaceae bacterium]
MRQYEKDYEVLQTGLVEYKPKEKKASKIIKKATAGVLSLGMVFVAGYAGASFAIRAMPNLELPASYQIGELIEETTPIVPIRHTPATGSLTELFNFANPGVVAISTETLGINFFGQTVTRPSSGSGFIISEEGYIVTNYHVIEASASISVILYDGEVYPAALVGTAPNYDLAVLKILTDRDLTALSFTNSEPQVGEQVVAIGNPLGEFANSMSVGHVSALNRTITIDGLTFNAIQTDAAVNRGNSGGPLVNTYGEVVGVVTAKSGGHGVEGLGFAIPAYTANEIITNIIEGTERTQRAVLGIIVNPDSLTISHIGQYSAAYRANMELGDRILAINDEHVFNHQSLRDYLDRLAPGDIIEVTILRGSQILVKEVTLGMSIETA